MLINDKRALAYTARISWVRPIEGADNIELVGIQGWTCIARIGEFRRKDLCVYFEIDSRLPKDAPWAAFMSNRDFKVKTMKLNKFHVISQGLALPYSAFEGIDLPEKEMQDVTDLLGVTYIDAADAQEKKKEKSAFNEKYKKITDSGFGKFMCSHKLTNKIMLLLFGDRSPDDSFPAQFKYVHKTDEERIENMTYILKNKDPWVVTTKIDGSSGTYILQRKPRDKFEFYVCSRNKRVFAGKDTSCRNDSDKPNIYWAAAEKYHIKDFLQKLLDDNPHWEYAALQGEIAGPDIQGNPHKFKELRFFGFNLINSEDGRYPSLVAESICSDYDIPWVPIVDTDYRLPRTLEELKAHADGQCEAKGSSGLREGYVYRSLDGQQSFKNVSNKYLLRKGK